MVGGAHDPSCCVSRGRYVVCDGSARTVYITLCMATVASVLCVTPVCVCNLSTISSILLSVRT